MEHSQLYIILASIFSFFMAWGVGANDVANAMGTSVGSKAVTLTQAILIAAIFEVLGSLFAGGQVTDTIRGEIINANLFSQTPQLLVFGMLASLLAAGTWLIVATSFGWPVSTTHSIVGAVIGFGLTVVGAHAIHWYEVTNIVLSWIITPIIAGVIAYFLFRSVQWFIFDSETPLHNAKRYVPWYIFLVTLIVSLVTFLNGLKHVGLRISNSMAIGLSIAFSFVIMLFGYLLLRRIPVGTDNKYHIDFQKLEKVFGILMIFTACAMAFAHGSNDVANAIGPLAAVVGIVKGSGAVLASARIPFWIMLLGALGIVTGLTMYGYKVIATIGTNITQLTPSRGFAAQLATASTVVVASAAGLPISTTQTLVGAVLGVGVARGIGALNLSIVRNIFMSWIVTLPAGAIFSIIYYHLLKTIFL
ncbi:inorganic phosphate transporter [Coxiella burnetii]|uniref:inorganic phosphate transporter n=1 Tax=Coxiella burnetii TaxID=777 RepID=UPI000183D0FF|nr:inorganic phosphate transporter [Coxiella burnetii]ACJ17720.1 low-affinity inorganic phosphate transporter [Coxiella burnetii CbuG_Q212]ATN66166.1 phosphate permease [Coxiella burnetii]OYK86870.1 inorganic phosphate transporter [Coxiella burnetii]